MSGRAGTRDGTQERVYRALLLIYPAHFRARYAEQLVQLFGDQLRDARAGGAPASGLITWLRTLKDLALTAASEHARRDRTVAHSLTVAPSTSSRILGVIGILGGTLLLAAFVVQIGPGLNTIRIILFNLGAIAIVVAVHRRQAPRAPGWALVGAVPAVLANAAYLVWIVIAADFGLVGFYLSIALWLADAWFGLVTFRLGVVARWAALALAIGSVVGIAGIDRLGLTSEANPTIFGTLALGGLAQSGIGWILLGIDVATRRDALRQPPQEVRPER
jgi:hypothetical protein